MRTLLAGAIALLLMTPASAQIRKFKDWLAACDNQRNCVAYSWNRDSYNAYLRIQRDGAPSADARLTLAISSEKPVRFKVEAAADPVGDVFEGVGDDVAGIGVMRGQRMPVDHAMIGVVFLLQRDPVLQRADEVTEM